MFLQKSADGRKWGDLHPLANIEMGDYQISWPNGKNLGTAFDFHPEPLGLNGRSNIYYLQTGDGGTTWKNIRETVELPLLANPALVYDSVAEKKLVYLKDLNYDAEGRPVILFLMSGGYASGPKNDPRIWWTLRWTGERWEKREFTRSDSNYDHGSLTIEADGTWRIIAPTEAGPQPYNPGGEMVLWTSVDQGASWKKERVLTEGSKLNHTYARRPLNAHPGFYALWADGNGRQPSRSRLYFTNQAGEKVWRLPERMERERAKPEVVP
ncbi:MAG: hypothetical protein U0903_19595 [Planctomycetales bacterium]